MNIVFPSPPRTPSESLHSAGTSGHPGFSQYAASASGFPEAPVQSVLQQHGDAPPPTPVVPLVPNMPPGPVLFPYQLATRDTMSADLVSLDDAERAPKLELKAVLGIGMYHAQWEQENRGAAVSLMQMLGSFGDETAQQELREKGMRVDPSSAGAQAGSQATGARGAR